MAKGYIYHIINKKNNKHYIGKTFDIDSRISAHFSDLNNQKHHSHKLQRAFNLYGEEYFIVEYKIIDINDENDLNLKEMQEIADQDSYNNGYNETLGGDGHKLSIDLLNSILIYNICQAYKGVNRQIAKYFKCDHTVINQLAKNKIFEGITFDYNSYLELIAKIGLKEENKNENYVPHNLPKMNREKCLELLSVITQTEHYEKTMCSIFNIDSKLSWRLKKGLIYKEYYNEFIELSKEEKKQLLQNTLEKYNVESIYSQRQRRCVKNALTQEQVNYILDHKDKISKAQIARDLSISADRVGHVCNGTSYKDLIKNYYSSKN